MRDTDLQKIYNEWRKTVTIEGMPFTWLGKEENIEAFSKFANLDKPVEFGQMLDLEGNYDSEECNMFEVKKIYKTKEDCNLEDGSFIKSGTSFFVISKDNYGYNIVFENSDRCYFEHDSRKYYIDELDLELFADSSSGIYRKEFEEKRNLKNNYDNRSATVDNIENRIDNTKEDNTKKEFNSKKSVEKEAQPFFNLDKIKEIPLEDVCNRLGIHTSSKGKKIWCDIRGEKTPSCCINIDKNYWYDFGTSTGGDVIKFVSEVEKINAKESIYRLANMFGIEPENNIDINFKPSFYISNLDYREIGIEPNRAMLNIEINLEKQALSEVIELEKTCHRSMNELANSDKEMFLDILNNKSMPIVYNNIKAYYSSISRIGDYVLEGDTPIDGFKSLETLLYIDVTKHLEETINKQIDILHKAGINEKIGFKLEKNKVNLEKNLNDIFNATLQNGVELMYNNSPDEIRIIKSINELREYIVDYSVPELGEIEVVEEIKIKTEKEVKTWTCIDLIDWCDDNDVELVPLRKEKVVEIEKPVLEVKIQPKMNK
ncbi:TPA: CHC2 zinc finger domain-containing protein [Clostridium perfringens]